MSSSGKSSTPPTPPPHDYSPFHGHLSASEPHLAHSPPVPSPLNPSAHSSPNTTPTQKPLPLPLTAASSSTTPPVSVQITGPALRGRPRGASISTLRNSPHSVSFPTLERVASQPAQPSSLSSSLSSLTPPDHERARSLSFTIASLGHRPHASRSPSPAYGFRRSRNETPPRGAPQTWWGRARDDTSVRPWADTQRERRKKSVPEEQTKAWETTRARVEEAAMKVLDVGLDVLREALRIGVDVMEFVPAMGLQEAARALLGIWDALQYVELNRMACLRLTERCADILLSVKDEIDQAGEAVANELEEPLQKLIDAFHGVYNFLTKQVHRPFLKRYLKRDDIAREIAGCDTALGDALEMFGIRIQVRILKQIQANEARRQEEARLLYESLRSIQQHAPYAPATEPRALPAPTGLLLEGAPPRVQSTVSSPDLPALPSTPSTPSSLSLSPVDPLLLSTPSPAQISAALRRLRARENELDRLRDADDLRALMRTALETQSDAEMCAVLQVARDEMPEAIKTLQRELEREVAREGRVGGEAGEVVVEEVSMDEAMAEWSVRSEAATSASATGRSVRTRESVASIGTRVGSRRDTLDREFIEGGLEALKRMSRGTEASLQLPSWTITRYEVDREEKIGIGYFSDVYRGTWRGRSVAIKCLAETTPRSLFIHETGIWKTLDHPNVLPLLGASSASGDPPWFFVSPYCRSGSLVEFLKAKGEDVDLLKAMHEVARGMEYLHGKGVLHGDLKAANVLVFDDGRCVISDFGQSEMKSEVARVSGTPPPHGTLRWQSPELMAGENELTPEMDVYSFAICCIEILGHGKLPWAMADDDSVRHYVLERNMRPEIPKSKFVTSDLERIIRVCWDRDPRGRPLFSTLARDIRQLRVKSGSKDADTPMVGWRLPSVMEDHSAEPSPDPRPQIPLPSVEPETDHTGSSLSTNASYKTAHGTESDGSAQRRYDTMPPPYASTVRPGTSHGTHGATDGDTTTRKNSIRSQLSISTSSLSDIEFLPWDSGYVSPLPPDEVIAETKNERRYRMLLQHEFNPNLTLPLWTPTKVSLGDVGYLSKPSGHFVTLFNAYDPVNTSGNALAGMRALETYGTVKRGTQKQDKRTVAQRGWEVIQGFLPSRRSNDSSPQSVTRRYTFQLRTEHKTAYLCTETTVYRYLEPDAKHAPYAWFKDNIDRILAIYGERNALQREDIFLVIGTLNAPDWALFVSHHHPNGLVHFNVFSGQKVAGQRWGEFEFDFSDNALGPGPAYHEDLPDGTQPRFAQKVSSARSGPWDTVVLSRLRFKPDAVEPTAR
ncbi:hypothetical protein NEOLEDRAFT_1072805 [Neolentinus lepideus HHB14362 ss-1]|uniref:Protein kinase domain-containing protein n=1 Tax=Neolentinus lepideus HHB14362 ss-1 TaxID=1314782 RepID=A0A165Q3Y3_9AGAM|nr:hypothetical protein NEOLEDRAFT_1072805 [Neolentinus lepideus HHB14362 ss-1]